MLTASLPELWSQALEDIVAEQLEAAGVSSPPVDAIDLAAKLGASVAIDRRQQERGRHKSLGGRAAIFLKPDDRPERLQWAAAHELGEMHAGLVFQRVTLPDGSEPTSRVREAVANLLASQFLLPGCWFFADLVSLAGDLIELKATYRTASHELIAYRMLDLPVPTVVTVFDQGRVTRRTANQVGRPPHPQPVERRCRLEVHRLSRSLELREAGLTVSGWPIHEPGWRREILRTTPSCHAEEAYAIRDEFPA